MADAILKVLDAWYNEPTQGSDRPKLISKLAALELCGWIEGELDRLVIVAETGRLNHLDWVKSDILKRNAGFTYAEHLRPMLCKLVGEIFARRIEQQMEATYPGELDQLRSSLGTLWKLRCNFAHADVVANVAAQQTFEAPSWFLNQHRLIKKFLTHYEASMVVALQPI
jgi:hypothetical protein